MADAPEFGRRVQILYRSEEHKAQLEAENSLAQFDHALELVEQWGRTLRLTPEVILESHRLATQNIYGFAGQFRDQFVSVEPHTPPNWRKVPELVAEMCDHANSICREQDATLVAAYLMWRLNWIHPFYDGNGRVSRIISYLSLCVAVNQTLPGTRTIPNALPASTRWGQTAMTASCQFSTLCRSLTPATPPLEASGSREMGV